MDINISLNLQTQNIDSKISKHIKNEDACERKCESYETETFFKDDCCSTIKEESCFRGSDATTSAVACCPVPLKTTLSKTTNCKIYKPTKFYCKPLKPKPMDHLQTTYQNSFRDPSKVKQTPTEKNGSTNLKFCNNHCA
jgi:hypothetical protein